MPEMFVVTDGTLNTVTDAIVVERREELTQAVAVMRQLIVARGGDPDAVTVNPVGPPVWDKAVSDEIRAAARRMLVG